MKGCLEIWNSKGTGRVVRSNTEMARFNLADQASPTCSKWQEGG